MSQKPSVGRIVHYTPPIGETAGHKAPQPYAAVITHVWGDTMVNLSIPPDGSFPLADGTPTSVEFSEEPGQPRTWSWPPFVPPSNT